MISSNPKDYYYFVKENDEIYLGLISDLSYDDCLVEIDSILSKNGIHEQCEQLYYTDMTADDAVATLERLGFVQNDEFDEDMANV